MYLEKFEIKNFRGIGQAVLHFQQGVNILIGENNAGKSTVIDALRLCFGFGGQRRDIYITESDFYVNKGKVGEVASEIEFHLFFRITNQKEIGWFHDFLNTELDGSQDIQWHIRYYWDDLKIKYRMWGGSKEGQPISPDALFLISHVYLDALRNAEQQLRPTRGNRLGQLYSHIRVDANPDVDKEKKQEMAKRVRSAIESDTEWMAHVETGKSKISEHLNAATFTKEPQKIDISFLPFDFNRLVDTLRIQIPIYEKSLLTDANANQEFFELHQNGLGYNNLIYAATVFGDLRQKIASSPEGYSALLIEEPEAHLHPQLQNVFFQYFNQLDADHGFQVFISSHSPTITAKARLESVIVMQCLGEQWQGLSLSKTGLSSENLQYLRKFLDVTKSQLFFSKAVILVEGISEALLLSEFSKMMGVEHDFERNGVEVVNVNGVAFSHFANLFNNTDLKKNLIGLCALLTDDDRDAATGQVSARADKTKSLEGGNLKVFMAEQTFEYELLLSGNGQILHDIFADMHPTVAKQIKITSKPEDYAQAFLERIISSRAKSELAHRLVVQLASDKDIRSKFKIPQYIQAGIKHVTPAI